MVTTILSPTPTNGGTAVLTPLSKIAGLYDDDTVCPLITGSVSAVSASIERAKQEAGDKAMFLDSQVIANPDMKLWSSIL